MLVIFLFVLELLALATCQETDCICAEHLPEAEGLTSITVFQSPPDGTRRKFIAEQTGLVWIFDDNNVRLPEPFLNLTHIVFVRNEDGFLGIAFHPEFATNRQLYIYYATNIDEAGNTRVSELLADANNPNVADYSSERIVMEFEQLNFFHNGGDLLFGADNLLYIFVGDGASGGGDPEDNAQNVTNHRGSILRIDVDSRDFGEYGIPPDNPFLSVPGALPELYAIGLRNPWRGSMDTGDRDTGEGYGRIFLGDVGQNSWEEVDIIEAGGNYGWAGREGNSCFKEELCGNTEPEVFPLTTYAHNGFGGCVIGGYVYRGCQSPDYSGWYYYADFANKQIRRGLEVTPGNWVFDDIVTCSTACQPPLTNDILGGYILAFGTDADGEVYVSTADTYSPLSPAHIYKIVQPSGAQPPCPLLPRNRG